MAKIVLETPTNNVRPKGTPDSASLVTALKANKGGRPRVADEMKADKYKPLSKAQADALTHKVAQLEGKLLAHKTKSEAEIASLKASLKGAKSDVIDAKAQCALATSRLADQADLATAKQDAAVHKLMSTHAKELQESYEKGAAFAQKLMGR